MTKINIVAAVALLLVSTGAFAVQDDQDLLTSAQENWKQIEALVAEREQMPEGVDRDVQTTRISRIARNLKQEIGQLVDRIQSAAGSDASADRAAASELLEAASRLTRGEIDHQRGVITSRRAAADGDTNQALIELEQQITRDGQDLDSTLSTLLQIAGWKEALSMDASGDLAYIDRVLEERIEELMALTEVSLDRRDTATKRLASASDGEKAALQPALQASKEALHGATVSLESTIALMDKRGLDTSEAKELLIRATGNVTTDIFDPAVLFGLLAQAWRGLGSWLSANGTQLFFKVVLFVAILGMSRIVAGAVRRVATRAVNASEANLPQLLKNMVVSSSGTLVMAVGVVIALSQIGIDIAPLLAGVGVAGFIVGFALQDTLSNFASGVMILFYHPFDVGDVVEAGGVSGSVHYMSLVSTTIRTFDNQILVVPNNKIWGGVIRNKTSVKTRRVDLSFGIGYDDDIAHAERVLHEIVAGHALVLDDPPPTIKLNELGDSSVNFVVRPWVKTQDYWDVHWDITRAVKVRFDAEGISIPFPQRDVHVHETGSSEPLKTAKTLVPETARPREKVPATGISADDD